MGERPDRPGDVRRDPLDRPDALGEGGRDSYPLTDPAGTPEVARPVGPDPALGGGVGGGAVIDEDATDRAEIERTEIERTRADMSETVDAVQERLSPENLKEEAKDRVKEATVGRAQEAGSGIVETIRANPLPAALTGIGLGWLLVSARRSASGQSSYRDRVYGYPPRYEDQGVSASSAGHALGQARDSVGESASRAQDKVGDLASEAQGRAGKVASRAQDRVSNLADQARFQARRASGGFQRMLRENPLTMGALAIGTGAAVGLAIPQTTREHEAMGEARDNLVDTVQEKAQEAQQKVQRVAEEAQSAAKEEATNQGLTNE
jgi:ElaB/YqjD/DUF883 family membrane-anchored ribosome-binding protein